MTCVESQENLTALLHHELSLGDEQSVREHLAHCDTCREQQQKIAVVMKTVRQFVPIEPSARARAELQERIEDVITREKNKGSGERAADTNAPHWKLASPPPVLQYEPPKALPLPAPDRKPEVASLSPSARAVSARLSATSARSRRFNHSKLSLWMAVIFAAGCAALAAYIYLKPAKSAEDILAKQERIAASRRLEDRQAAKVRGKKSDTLISTQVQLGAIAGDDATLHVLPHYNPASGEICLVAYRDDDIARLSKDESIDQSAFSAMVKRAVTVKAVDGKFALPRTMVADYVGLDHKAAIFDLENRIEIWSGPRLDSYLSGKSHSPIASVAASQGLPPEKQP
jgi:hypothetical protein